MFIFFIRKTYDCLFSYVESIMPDKEKPEDIYIKMRHRMMQCPFEVHAMEALKMLERFFKALPDDWTVYRRYVTAICDYIKENRSKSHFDRRMGLHAFSMIMKKTHQVDFDIMMVRNKNNPCMNVSEII